MFLSCDHQGLKNVTENCKNESHKANVEYSKKAIMNDNLLEKL